MKTDLAILKNTSPINANFFNREFDLTKTSPAQAYLSTLSPTGRDSMKSRLNQVVRFISKEKIDSNDYLRFDFSGLKRFHCEQIMHNLKDLKDEAGMPIYSPSHLKTTWMGIRKVSEQAWSLGQLESEEYLKIKGLKFDFGETPDPGRAVPILESSKIIEECLNDKNKIIGFRDAALISLLVGGGLRRQEAASLKINNFDFENSEIRFLGKRNKVHEKIIPSSTNKLIKQWIDEFRGDAPGAIFCRILSNGEIRTDWELTGAGIYKIVVNRVRNAGFKYASPHDFRKGLATHLLDSGVDIVEVRDVLGHKSIATTQTYIRKNKERIRSAVAKVFID